MFVKEHASRIRREVTETGINITSTMVLCVFMALLVFILGTFINDNFKKLVVPEELYFSQFSTLPKLRPSYYLCHHSSSFSTSSSLTLLPFNISRSKSGFRGFSSLAEGVWHSMSDEELMRRAVSGARVADRPYKVAFMFLTRGSLPLGPLWERFFKGHEGLFSIYLHTSPDFTYEPPNSSAFYKRRIPSKLVQWGKASMIDGERRLLANALLDISNQRFVLLSETCIPIFNFTTIYNYLINSNQSFLNSFDDPRKIGRGRYNKRMWPDITLSDWRKGSQWFEVNRELAIKIVSDTKYYPVFRNHCLPPCYMDEHYLPTLVNMISPASTTNRTVTWTDWSAGGSHPARFVRKDVSEEFLNRVRYGFNCTYNGEMTLVCFLFARKFHPGTLEPLLRIAPRLLGFNP